MSDELDPTLLRLFVEANEPLPGADFSAQLTAHLHRPPTWPGLAQSLRFAVRGALAGIMSGVVTPFRMGGGYVGAMIASAAALTLWITLQTP